MTSWALACGVAAAVLLAVAGLYGVRRRAMRAVSKLGLGRARTWLAVHVWVGLLFLLLVLAHSGFRLPAGGLSWWLWGLSLASVVTGLLGLALQRSIPRMLASGLSIEVHYDRIPELVAAIRREAEELVAASDPAVQRIYARHVAAALRRPRRDARYFLDVTGGRRARLRELDYLRGFLADGEKEKLRRLERLYTSKLEIDAHYTLQQVLRGWLWLHLPVALLLAALVAVHVAAVIYW